MDTDTNTENTTTTQRPLPPHIRAVLDLPRARELIGHVPDLEASRELRTNVWLIRRVRGALGMPPVRSREPRAPREPWIPGWLAQHPEIRPMLGIVPDGDLADKYNASKTKIKAVRAYLEIPSCRSAETWERRNVPPDLRDALGTVSDSELSRQYGIHQTTITAMRNRLGIPVFDPNPDRIPATRTSLNEAVGVLRETWERKTKRGSNELARAMGISPLTLYDATTGRRHPSIAFVWRVAQVVEITITIKPDGTFVLHTSPHQAFASAIAEPEPQDAEAPALAPEAPAPEVASA